LSTSNGVWCKKTRVLKSRDTISLSHFSTFYSAPHMYICCSITVFDRRLLGPTWFFKSFLGFRIFLLWNCLLPIKDHIEKIDFQELYFCCRQLAKFRTVRGICLYNMLHWLVCYRPAGQSFPDFGVWVSVDFDLYWENIIDESWIDF